VVHQKKAFSYIPSNTQVVTTNICTKRQRYSMFSGNFTLSFDYCRSWPRTVALTIDNIARFKLCSQKGVRSICENWVFFSGEGPRSRRYGRTAALRLLVQPCDEDDDDDDLFVLFLVMEAPVEWNWQGKTEILGENPVPVPRCPPQIPHGLTRGRTRASAVGGRRLTAWAMARPKLSLKTDRHEIETKLLYS
jgi:hypothetical protein